MKKIRNEICSLLSSELPHEPLAFLKNFEIVTESYEYYTVQLIHPPKICNRKKILTALVKAMVIFTSLSTLFLKINEEFKIPSLKIVKID